MATPPGYDGPVRRTSIKLPEALDELIRVEAAQRGVTVSTVVRAAVEEWFDSHRGARVLAGSGSGQSGLGDGSLRVQELAEFDNAQRLGSRSVTVSGDLSGQPDRAGAVPSP